MEQACVYHFHVFQHSFNAVSVGLMTQYIKIAM